MKSIIYLTIYLLSLSPLIAQITVSGKIIDMETKKNVEFVTVSVKNKNIGTYTDSLGKFVLNNCNHNDTLIIKHIAYKKSAIPLTYFLKESVFFITPETNLIGDVIIAPRKTKEYKAGCTTCNSNSSISSFKGYEVATLIKNDKNIENSYIKNILLCVKKEKETSFYIRIHLYANDNNRPGVETKYNNLHFIKNEKGIIKIDISNYMIPFPAMGLFIGIEWVSADPKGNSNEHDSISPRLLISDKQTNSITYYHLWDLPWEDLSSLIGRPKMNALIGLTLIK